MERPILFSTPMVQAILEGRKTQTRRIIKFPDDFDGERVYKNYPFGLKYGHKDGTVRRLFPKWNIGDNLWVREIWRKRQFPNDNVEYFYKADMLEGKSPFKWMSSIFMPKEVCRIKLEILDIRAERLQDISEEDCIAEGILELAQSAVQLAQNGRQFFDYSKKPELFNDGVTAKESYKSLWQSINGKDSWSKNPWVWVMEFKKIT